MKKTQKALMTVFALIMALTMAFSLGVPSLAKCVDTAEAEETIVQDAAEEVEVESNTEQPEKKLRMPKEQEEKSSNTKNTCAPTKKPVAPVVPVVKPVVPVVKPIAPVKPVTCKVDIHVTPNGDEVVYDGDPHFVAGFEGSTPDGGIIVTVGKCKYVIRGLIAGTAGTDAGTYPVNVAGKARVYDMFGHDVTHLFNVKIDSADLIIKKRDVEITAESYAGEYDGKEHTVSGFVGETEKGVPVVINGKTYYVKGLVSEYTGKNVSDSIDEIPVTGNAKVYDKNGRDVTDCFNVKVNPGSFTITAVQDQVIVTIVGNKDSVKYDGQPHDVKGFVVKSIEYKTETADSIIFSEVYDLIVGLEVSAAEGDSKPAYTEDDFSLIDGAKALAEGTNAGEYPMGLTEESFQNNNENFANVKFVVEDGGLTIEKREVVLESGNAEKKEDGEPLKEETVTVGGDGFAEGEGATFSNFASQTKVGSTNNTFEYALNDNTNPDNYTITVKEGTLKVTEAIDDDDDDDDDPTNPSKKDDKKSDSKKDKSSVDTGDNSNMLIWIVAGLFSIVALAVLALEIKVRKGIHNGK